MEIKIKVYNIEWDTDGELYVFNYLPQEVEMKLDIPEEDMGDIEVFIGRKLFNDYEYPYYRFEYKVLEREDSCIFTISMKEGKTECEDCPFRQWSSMTQDWVSCKKPPFPCNKYNLMSMQFE